MTYNKENFRIYETLGKLGNQLCDLQRVTWFWKQESRI